MVLDRIFCDKMLCLEVNVAPQGVHLFKMCPHSNQVTSSKRVDTHMPHHNA